MVTFLSPEVITQEAASAAIPFLSTTTNITWSESTATRGPVNRSVLTVGLQDWESVYGKDDGGFGRQSAAGYFNNQGRFLIQNRVAHYTDITDRDTLTAVAAEIDLDTESDVATSAAKTTGIGPFNLTPAAGVVAPVELIALIDGAGPDTALLEATPSVLTAVGVPLGVGTATDTLVFDVNGVTRTYIVPGAPPTTASDWALSIGAQLEGISADVVGGVVVLTTDKRGSIADVDYVSGTGTAGADSGFGAGPTPGVNAGPNDVVDLSAVTNTELGAVLVSDWTSGGGVTTTDNANGSLTVETVATGAAASIGAVTGSAAAAVAFTPGGVATGVAAGAPSVPTLKFLATSEGTHGNTLAVTTDRSDLVIGGVAVDIPLAPFTEFQIDDANQLRVGLQLFLEDTVTGGEARVVVAEVIGTRVLLKDPVTPTFAITAANSPTVTKETFNVTFLVDGDGEPPFFDLSMDALDINFYVGAAIGEDPDAINPRQRIYVENLAVVLSNTIDPRPIDAVEVALAGGLNSAPLVDLDYIGSVSTSTGLHSADQNLDFSLLAVPGIETVAVHRAIQDYANGREDHLAILNAPAGLSATEVKDYVQITARLFSTYVTMYAGEPTIIRESTGAQTTFPASLYLAGIYARTDQSDNVSQPAAGVRKGQLAGVIGVGNNNLYSAKPQRDILYPDPGVNTIFAQTRGILAWGQLTLDPNSDRGTIGVRRAMLSLRRDIARISDFVLFELNTEELRQEYQTKISGYLRAQFTAGVLQGNNEGEAFFIKCDAENNPPSVVNSRQFFAEIGVNVIPAIDYAIITIRRDTRALEAELAAA